MPPARVRSLEIYQTLATFGEIFFGKTKEKAALHEQMMSDDVAYLGTLSPHAPNALQFCYNISLIVRCLVATLPYATRGTSLICSMRSDRCLVDRSDRNDGRTCSVATMRISDPRRPHLSAVTYMVTPQSYPLCWRARCFAGTIGALAKRCIRYECRKVGYSAC